MTEKSVKCHLLTFRSEPLSRVSNYVFLRFLASLFLPTPPLSSVLYAVLTSKLQLLALQPYAREVCVAKVRYEALYLSTRFYTLQALRLIRAHRDFLF